MDTPEALLQGQGRWGAAGETVIASFPADRLLRERIRRNRSHQQFDLDDASYDGQPMDSFTHPQSERLVVVANRLPVTCSKDGAGNWQLQVRGGGG